MAFKLTKYSYKALRQLSVQDRLQVTQDREMGQWLLSLLTPSQFVDLFPKYYRESMPDISGFVKAMPSSMTAAKQRAAEEQLNNTVSGAAAGANYKAGGWKKKYQEGLDNQRRVSVSKAGVVPPPQLSPEQRKSFDDLKAAPMTADDPRAKMFAGLSAEQMAKVGISKVTENGKEVFKYSAPSVSEEEARKYISEGGPRVGLNSNSSLVTTNDNRLMTALGANQSQYNAFRQAMVSIESAGGKYNLRGGSSGRFSGAYQIGGGELKEVAAYLGEQAPIMSRPSDGKVVANDEFLRNPALQEKYFDTYTFLHHKQLMRNKIYSGMTIENKLRVLGYAHNQGVGGAINWLETGNAGSDAFGTSGTAYSKAIAAQLRKVSAEDPIAQDYSQKSLDLAREKLIRRKEEERIGSLAQYTSAQLSPVEQAALSSAGSKASDALINKFNGKAFANAKGNTECATFAQSHGVGHTSGWSPGSSLMNGGMKPGDWIALFQDGKYTNKSGSAHTAMFVGYERDANGKITGVKVLDQWNKRGQVGVSTWHPGSGGEMDPLKYHQIMDQGKPASMYNTVAELDGQSSTPQAPQPKVDSKKIEETQTAPTSSEEISAAKRRGELSPPVPRAGPQGDASISQVETPKVTNKSAEPTPERYRVDTAKFINAIKATPEFKSQAGFFAGMVPDSTIINGFNDDPRVKAAGVHLDEKGVMHFKRGMTGDVKQVMADFDTKSFMTKIEEEKKKPDVKPTEQKPVEKPASERPPVPTPANPAPQVETPKVTNKPTEAPAIVKTNAMGGVNKINTEEISAYPIGGLNGDNAVVVNKAQKPLFTMNTNESMTIDPRNDTATVTPNNKERNVGATQPSPLESMFSDFTQSVRNLSDKFDMNKTTSEPAQRSEPFPTEGGSWLNNLNKLTEQSFHSPSSRRAFYRSQGQSVDNGTGTNHFSHGNNS